MTADPDPLDAHLDALGRALHDASRRPRPAPRCALRLATAGAAALALAGGLLVALPGGGDVDVVQRAAAALAPDHGILHYRVQTTIQQRLDGRWASVPPGCDRGRQVTEVWQATSPARWRMRSTAPPSGPRCGASIDRHGHRTRTWTETAWDAGTSTTYDPRNRTFDVVRGYPATSSQRRPTILEHDLEGGDPVAGIRRLLAEGRLRDDGERDESGRRVRVLVAAPRRAVFGATRRVVAMTYVVDAASFVPVRVERLDTVTPRLRVPREHVTVRSIMSFERYERLPRDAATERLLTIRPRGRVIRTDMTLDEFRRELRDPPRLRD